MKELLIKIRSLFEGKGFVEATRGAKATGDATAEAGTKSQRAGNQISGSGRAAEQQGRAMGQAARETRQASSAMDEAAQKSRILRALMDSKARVTGMWAGAMASAANALGNLLLRGVSRLTSLLPQAVRELNAKRDALASLEPALRNAGQLTHAYWQELQRLAGEQQRATGIADTTWYKVFETLTQIGGASEQNIGQYTEAVKQLAAVTGTDVENASMLFARAVQGNFEMLSRYGISLRDAADDTEKLNQLMEMLANRGAGVLENRARTLTGAWQILKGEFGDLLANLAQAGTEGGGLQRYLEGWGKAIALLNDRIGDGIPTVSKLTEEIRMQSRSAEELARAQKAAADEIAALEKANQEAIRADDERLRKIEKMKSEEENLARLRRDLAVEQVRADDTLTESDKLARIAAINEEFRAEEINRERAHEQEKIRLRADSAQEAEATARKIREEHASAEAAAEEAAQHHRQQQAITNQRAFLQEQLAQANAARAAMERENQGGLRTRLWDPDEHERLLNLTSDLSQKIAALPDIDTGAETAAAKAGEAADLLSKKLAEQEQQAERLRKLAEEEKEESDRRLEILEQVKAVEEDIARTREESGIENAKRAEQERKAAEEAARLAREEAEAERAAALARQQQCAPKKPMTNAERLRARREDVANRGLDAFGASPEESARAVAEGRGRDPLPGDGAAPAIDRAATATASGAQQTEQAVQALEQAAQAVQQADNRLLAAANAVKSGMSRLEARIEKLESAAG